MELTSKQIAQQGETMYAERIQPLMQEKDHGRMLVLDVATGDYEIDDSGGQAAEILLARHPGANLYGLRIGHAAAGRIGGRRRMAL